MSRIMCRFERSRGLVLLMFVITACSKSPPPTATESAEVPAPFVVDLRPITISFRGEPIARLFADGRTESAGPNAPGTGLVPGPTIHADGTIALTKGSVTARIDDKGDIHVAGPRGANPREQLFGHISGDQFTFAGSAKPWDVRVQGNLIEFGEHDSSQIDGNVTPSIRHTALVMSVAFYIEGALATP
jgi:hypothetical protein